MILVDAGPLVALIDAGDHHHAECAEAFAAMREPLVTVWPAFTEAMYLLGFAWRAQDALWEFVSAGAVRLTPLDDDDCVRIRELMAKYRDVPMDMADAALVRLAEREKARTVFTLDRRGFSTYRVGRTGRFDIVP